MIYPRPNEVAEMLEAGKVEAGLNAGGESRPHFTSHKWVIIAMHCLKETLMDQSLTLSIIFGTKNGSRVDLKLFDSKCSSYRGKNNQCNVQTHHQSHAVWFTCLTSSEWFICPNSVNSLLSIHSLIHLSKLINYLHLNVSYMYSLSS